MSKNEDIDIQETMDWLKKGYSLIATHFKEGWDEVDDRVRSFENLRHKRSFLLGMSRKLCEYMILQLVNAGLDHGDTLAYVSDMVDQYHPIMNEMLEQKNRKNKYDK